MNYKGNSRFGALPRRTMIANQPHMLAYINPQEEMLLRQLGGTGQPGPMGVPAYPPGDGGFGFGGSGGYGGGGGFGGFGGSEAPGGGYGGPDVGFIPDNYTPDLGGYIGTIDDDGLPDVTPDVGFVPDNSTPDLDGYIGTSNVSDPSEISIGSTPATVAVPDNYTPDLGGYIGTIDDDGLPNVDVNEGDFINNPYAIDITDTNIYTENPDGTYTVEDGEPDPIEIDEPDPIINTGFPENPEEGSPDDFEPPVNQPEPEIDTAEYFNLFRSTQPSSWMSNSIWSSYGVGPDFDVDVYQEADGALRFRDTGDLVPEEYLKYIPYAKRTKMKAPGEEDEPIVEESVIEPLDDNTVVEPLDDDTVVEPVEEDAVETGTPSSTIITNQASDGSDFTDMTTIVDEPTDYSIDPSIAEATASTLSDRAQGFYDLVSSGNKSLYELNQLSLANNPKSRNPLVRQAAQDAVNEYLYSNLTPDELRAWLDGQFNPITDPTSSVYNPQGIPEGLL